MPFSNNQNEKKPDINKNGTPRKHGNTIMQFFRLEQEYIDLVDSLSEQSEIPKSKIYREIIHDYFKDSDHDESIKFLILQKIRSKKRKEFEKVYGFLGEEIKQIYVELHRIGNNINQIAKRSNQGYYDENLGKEIEACENLLSRFEELNFEISDRFSEMKDQY